jgi:hypothetical protein
MGRDESREAREALDDWRVAERALSDAARGLETARRVAESASLAARAATETAEAAIAALEAAQRAERSARATAEAARMASATADDDVTSAERDERVAIGAEEAAHGRHRDAAERARQTYSDPNATISIGPDGSEDRQSFADEVLAAWREAERILEDYRARNNRDRAAEQRLVEAIAGLRDLHASLTSHTIPDADLSLRVSHERIAQTRMLLRSLQEGAGRPA